MKCKKVVKIIDKTIIRIKILGILYVNKSKKKNN